MYDQHRSLEKVSEKDSDEDSQNSRTGQIKNIGSYNKEVDSKQEEKYMQR